MGIRRMPDTIIVWNSRNGAPRWSEQEPTTREMTTVYVHYAKYVALLREFRELRDHVEDALKEATRDVEVVKLPE